VRARAAIFWAAEVVLLLPALLLTFTRVVEPHGRLWITVEAFTPWGIGLYAVALLVAVLRVVLTRRWRSLTGLTALLAVMGLALHGWWWSPQVTGANPPPAEGAEPLVVMTANLYVGEADGIDLVSAVSEEHVDLLVLEEVTPAVLADMQRAGLDDLLPYRVPEDDASLTMAFSRQPITDPVALDLPLGGWSFETADLTVLAVHPSPPTMPAAWYADHDRLVSDATDLDPDLIVGDLNATEDHAPLRALTAAGYRDAGELANDGWQPTWPMTGVFDLLGFPLAQIDHVLVGPRLAALSMHTLDVPGSDHRAVVAEVAHK
jgi:endonuclease/exonuclease/phosphatase family metal-dependent hydrolase